MRILFCHLLAALALAAVPATVQAQTRYDANCQPITPSEDQVFQQELCKSHAGCAMVVSAGQGFCKGVDFFRNIGDKITGTKPLTNDDVIDVVELDYPKSTFTSRIMDKVKSVTNAVFDSKPEAKTFAIGDGSKFAYAETLPSGSGQRAGAIIYTDGSAARGQFNDSFVNNGIGERVSATGQVSAGEFRNAVLSGEGFKTEGTGKDIDMYEGTFDNDVPVGEVVHRFADGTSARELWQNGKMVERGMLAARGKIPPPVGSTLSLASAKPDGDGMFERPGADGRWRQELWCKGRMVDAGTWSDKGKAIAPQTKDRWKKDCPQYADAEEVESKDLVQHTISRRGSRPRTYDDSRTPTTNQLFAACPDQWDLLSAMDSRGVRSRDWTAANFIRELASSNTNALLDGSALANIYARYFCGTAAGWCGNEYRLALQCFVEQTLNGRAGQFRTPSMTVKEFWDDNTQGRQDPEE